MVLIDRWYILYIVCYRAVRVPVLGVRHLHPGPRPPPGPMVAPPLAPVRQVTKVTSPYGELLRSTVRELVHLQVPAHLPLRK